MSKCSRLFDLSPEDFFYTLVHSFTRYRRAKAKERVDLLYLMMGLNHLREWIAPGYDYNCPANHPNEIFYNEIYHKCPEWKILNQLCNRAKHVGSHTLTRAQYGLDMDAWPDTSGVVDWDKGPPSAFYYADRNMLEIIENVIAFYQAHWFKSGDIAILLCE